MEAANKFALGSLYQRFILLKVLKTSFYYATAVEFLHNFNKLSRIYLKNNLSIMNNNMYK